MSSPEIYLHPSYSQILSVARDMREWDAAEIYPMLRSKTPEDLAAMSLAATITGIVRTDHPIICFGFNEAGPKFYNAFMFATDEYRDGILTLTRFARREMIPFLFEELGANRIEARSMLGHTSAQAWMRTLGAIDECEIIDRGENRETYIVFSITRTAYERGLTSKK